MDNLNIAHGFCQCGCGERTRVATKTDRANGHVKGEPMRFRLGHHARLLCGEKSPHWKGGKSTSTHGYPVRQLADGTRQYAHILRAEKALGRKLRYISPGHPDNEVVHHIHGDKTREDDILICTHSYHTSLHHRLEQSDAWPEFPRITRNVGSKK